MNNNEVLIANNICKSYIDGSKIYTVLQNLNLTIHRGEVAFIVGPSGSGKSTLLKCIGAMDRVDTGSLSIAGQDISKMGDNRLSKIRANNLGFVFQKSYLIKELSVIENIMLPGLILKKHSKGKIKESAMELLSSVGLEKHCHSKSYNLSGGEQHRVAIARALINSPDIIIADEPTGNLDNENSEIIVNIMLKIAKHNNSAVIIATHNLDITKKSNLVYKIHNNTLECNV